MITAPMQPWLITLEAYRELCTVNFQSPAQSNAVDEKAQPYELRDGLSTVRIHGTMLRQVSPRQKAISANCGVRLCSMEETAAALLQAAADPAVHTILLDIDSPSQRNARAGTGGAYHSKGQARLRFYRRAMLFCRLLGRQPSRCYLRSTVCHGGLNRCHSAGGRQLRSL